MQTPASQFSLIVFLIKLEQFNLFKLEQLALATLAYYLKNRNNLRHFSIVFLAKYIFHSLYSNFSFGMDNAGFGSWHWSWQYYRSEVLVRCRGCLIYARIFLFRDKL